MRVELKGPDYQLYYSVFEPGAGCLDSTGMVEIGILKSGYRVFRKEELDTDDIHTIYTYHTLNSYYSPECGTSTVLANLENCGAAVSCSKNKEVCDEIVKSIEINDKIIYSYN